MLHRIPRSVRWVLLVAVLGAVTVSVLQSWTSAAPGTGGWQQTQWGPLGPADRDLLIKVRQAGLWEVPTGQQMVQQATNQQVRETGQHLAEQHMVLDQITRDAADKLGVQLPSRATDTQIAWMNQISNTTGADYDKVAVQLLRQAHGIVLPIVTEARVGTRNELVRQFADTTFQYVTGHIAMLEATGLVDYSALPAAPSPGLFSGATTPADMIVPAIVFLAAAGAAIGLLVTLRRGRKKAKAAGPATGSQVAALHEPLITIPSPRERRQRAALPAGRTTTVDEVSVSGGHRARRRSRSGSGDSGEFRRSDTGGFRRSDTGGFRRDDTGALRWVDAADLAHPDLRADDTGEIPAVPAGVDGSGRYRRARTAPAARGVNGSGPYPASGRASTAVSDSGGYRRHPSDSGGFRFDDLLGPDGRASSTGGHRVPRTTDTGGYRPARSPRSPNRGMTP